MRDTAAPPSAPAQVAPAAAPDRDALLPVVVGVAVVAALSLAREVLIPITLAVLLSFVLAPLVGLLRRLRLPDLLAVLLAVVLALGVIAGLGSLIGVQVADLAADAPRYAVAIQQKIETVQGFAAGRVSGFVGGLGLQERSATGQGGPAGPADMAADSLTGTGQKPIPVEVREAGATPLQIAQRVLSPVLSPIETTLIVLIVAVFFLLQRDDLRDRLIRLFGSGDLHRTTAALDDAARRLSRYFLSQLAINASFGVVVGAGLFLIGVPSAVLWGILGALLRFVPYVGAFIAASLPATLAAGVGPGWGMALETAVLFVAVETLTGQFIEPMVYGHSTGLSPAAVVVAAIFWTWLWGPIGLILSTPLSLCLVVLGRHVQRLEFLDILLGDRPSLTPAENFYQRMLAGDLDEAQDQAELLLKDRSLSAYYDEIALKGLQLATNDLVRGVLRKGQIERVERSVRAIVHDLDGHDDRDPHPDEAAEAAVVAAQAERAMPRPAPPADIIAPASHQLVPAWQEGASVLCLAGRGPLDDAVSTILVQLLGKHGLAARTAPHETASREDVATLDTAGVAMVCISYLDISGSPAHLRYLIRRLRRRLPHAPILVGLWPSEDAVLHDQRLRAIIGANHYTISLREAVQACVQVAREAAEGDSGVGTAGDGNRPHLTVVTDANQTG